MRRKRRLPVSLRVAYRPFKARRDSTATSQPSPCPCRLCARRFRNGDELFGESLSVAGARLYLAPTASTRENRVDREPLFSLDPSSANSITTPSTRSISKIYAILQRHIFTVTMNQFFYDQLDGGTTCTFNFEILQKSTDNQSSDHSGPIKDSSGSVCFQILLIDCKQKPRPS